MPAIYTWRQVRAWFIWGLIIGLVLGVVGGVLYNRIDDEIRADLRHIQSDGRTP